MKRAASLLLVSAACLAPAGGALAENLIRHVEQALAYDSTLASAQAARQAAEQARPQARAALLPNIDGSLIRQNGDQQYEGFPENSVRATNWNVTLTQPLFDWSAWLTYKQADLKQAQAGLAYADERQNLILKVAEAYFQVLASEDEIDRATRYVGALVSHGDLIARMRAAGEATLIDVHDARSSLEDARLQHHRALEDNRVKRLQLEQLSGLPGSGLARLDAGASLPELQPAQEAAWVEQASTQGYPVQIKRLEEAVAGIETDKSRAGHYPVVGLGWSKSNQASNYFGTGTLDLATQGTQLQVNIPIYSGGLTQSRVMESQALELKARNDSTSAARQSAAVAREQYLRLTLGLERVAQLSQRQALGRTALDATRTGYQVGSRTSVDVLRSLETLYRDESELIGARYEVILAGLRLKAAAASLEMDDIARINALLTGAARVDGGMPAADQVTDAFRTAPAGKLDFGRFR